MQKGEILKTVNIKGKTIVELDKIYPIQPIVGTFEVKYMIDEEEQTKFDNVYYANKLIVLAENESVLNICLGDGYLAIPNKELSDKFITDHPWQGGDGIFSFNIEDGNDSFDQNEKKKHLLVFGDTFVGKFDKKTERRYEPHLMPNNSLAYLQDGSIEFRLNTGKYGNIKSFYDLEPEFDYKGSIPRNLVNYDPKSENIGYLSGYNPEYIELVFDLHKTRFVDEIEIFNYYSPESKELAKRGMKEITISGSLDNQKWQNIVDVKLDMAKSALDSQKVDIKQTHRFFKITCNTENGIGNYNDDEYREGLFGLNRVKFYSNGNQLKDIYASSNTIMTMNKEHSWIWLQDGVVIKNNLYFLPLIVASDLTQVEGMQFKVLGINMFKTEISDGELKTEKTIQKLAPIYTNDDKSTYYFGAGIMSNTIQSGSKEPDGYIYIYGYKTTGFMREMIVARVKEENFEYFDDWEYFDGKGYSKDIFASQPILEHISCEMSVSQLLEGKYQGKYIAIFSYDTNTEYVSFAIGETPTGPFTKPQKIYKTPEQEIFKSTTYTYNAKAHPSLSESKKILVSYNTNTYNFEHNMSNRLIYKPRFIYLQEI